jgi:hypothetical protein
MKRVHRDCFIASEMVDFLVAQVRVVCCGSLLQLIRVETVLFVAAVCWTVCFNGCYGC